jgi:hypothetical protein
MSMPGIQNQVRELKSNVETIELIFHVDEKHTFSDMENADHEDACSQARKQNSKSSVMIIVDLLN